MSQAFALEVDILLIYVTICLVSYKTCITPSPSLEYMYVCTVEPLLSDHPRGTGKWSLNRGWPLNRGLSEISIMRGINITIFEYNTVGGLLNVIQPVFVTYFGLSSLIRLFKTMPATCMKFLVAVNGGKNNRKTLIGTTKRWLRSLNRGFINSIILTINSGL